MKLSNYTPKHNGLTPEEKQLIEDYFFGNSGKSYHDSKGIVLNKTKQISFFTGISEYRINRYIDSLLNQKRKEIDGRDSQNT